MAWNKIKIKSGVWLLPLFGHDNHILNASKEELFEIYDIPNKVVEDGEHNKVRHNDIKNWKDENGDEFFYIYKNKSKIYWEPAVEAKLRFVGIDKNDVENYGFGYIDGIVTHLGVFQESVSHTSNQAHLYELWEQFTLKNK